MSSKHFSAQFEEDLTKLKDSLLLMGGTIESMLNETHEALLRNDANLARRVIHRDVEVDNLEKVVDQQALQILALRQPAAIDLRFVTSAFKICTDLERMGDILVNICERICELAEVEQLKPYEILPEMMQTVRRMISLSLDSFVNQSTETAAEVLESDQKVDQMTREIFSELVLLMKSHENAVERGLKLFFITKHLERLADHSTKYCRAGDFYSEGLGYQTFACPWPNPIFNLIFLNFFVSADALVNPFRLFLFVRCKFQLSKNIVANIAFIHLSYWAQFSAKVMSLNKPIDIHSIGLNGHH